MAENFDVVVIGAGPGGYVAAIRAAQLKQKVAIVDRQWLGGVCLNVGCIPSKSLLKNAEVAHTLRHRAKDFGFSFDNLKLDYSVAFKRSRSNSDRLTKGVGFLMKKNNIAVFMGAATFKSKDTISVAGNDGKNTELKAQNIIIATGASAAQLPGVTVDGKKIVTYVEAIMQETLPKSAVIVGGGSIGTEFATIWNSYGVDVTIIELLPRILPREDEEISKELTKELIKAGVKIKTGVKFESIAVSGKSVKVKLPDETLDVDQALIATSFTPNSKGLGLETVGVKLTERGNFIEINEKMQTNIPGIWAIGDVTGKLMLAHVGSAMGIICAENIAGHETVTLNYDMMPRATYCHPQVASFGYTEAQAREKGYNIKVGRFPFQANGKALGLGDYAGFVKIVMDEKYGEILGAHMIGPEVTELLPELTLAQMMELTPREIARNVHAHPTLSETLMEAAHGAEGSPIHI
ncbi:MAG: dihydrolipoyl dehydrogenase [Chloroflexi bacterium]|nr:dihydrolipoyl dehydrogenase [Anaerolineales bacterium]RIK48764.1 MAG: dihydrolipoyl dehydrogenase [Chloroflexota bacterium]